ncbi:MAG: M50 family metallopeptidase [bacterium]
MKIKIGKIYGIQIEIHYTWVIVFFLFTWSLASGYFPQYFPGWSGISYWAAGAISTILLFGGVLVHELSHSLVAKKKGTDVKSITLFIFGGVAQIADEPKEASSELLIAISGPTASLILAGFFFLLAYLSPEEISSAIFSYLFLINIILAAFNLIPAFPLDGGRILRAIVWKWKKDYRVATRTAATTGVIFSYVLIFLGFFSLLEGNLVSGLWWIIIGWFLQNSAESSYQQLVIKQALAGLTVRSIMETEVKSVPPNITLEELAREHFLGFQQTAFFVTWGEEILGIVTISDLKKVPRDQWHLETVRQIMTPLAQLETVSPNDNAYDALLKMTSKNVGRLPVMEDGQLIGIITRQDLLDALRIRSEIIGI